MALGKDSSSLDLTLVILFRKTGKCELIEGQIPFRESIISQEIHLNPASPCLRKGLLTLPEGWREADMWPLKKGWGRVLQTTGH